MTSWIKQNKELFETVLHHHSVQYSKTDITFKKEEKYCIFFIFQILICYSYKKAFYLTDSLLSIRSHTQIWFPLGTCCLWLHLQYHSLSFILLSLSLTHVPFPFSAHNQKRAVPDTYRVWFGSRLIQVTHLRYYKCHTRASQESQGFHPNLHLRESKWHADLNMIWILDGESYFFMPRKEKEKGGGGLWWQIKWVQNVYFEVNYPFIGIVHSKIKILSSCTHPQVVNGLYDL